MKIKCRKMQHYQQKGIEQAILYPAIHPNTPDPRTNKRKLVFVGDEEVI